MAVRAWAAGATAWGEVERAEGEARAWGEVGMAARAGVAGGGARGWEVGETVWGEGAKVGWGEEEARALGVEDMAGLVAAMAKALEEGARACPVVGGRGVVAEGWVWVVAAARARVEARAVAEGWGWEVATRARVRVAEPPPRCTARCMDSCWSWVGRAAIHVQPGCRNDHAVLRQAWGAPTSTHRPIQRRFVGC